MEAKKGRTAYQHSLERYQSNSAQKLNQKSLTDGKFKERVLEIIAKGVPKIPERKQTAGHFITESALGDK